MGASWLFLYEAYDRIGVDLASLACYCGPVIVMVLSPLLFREAMTPVQALGAALIVGGAVFGELAGLRQKRVSRPPA